MRVRKELYGLSIADRRPTARTARTAPESWG
jgi:hypothetical protein